MLTALNEVSGDAFTTPDVTNGDDAPDFPIGVMRFRRVDGGGFSFYFDGGIKGEGTYWSQRQYRSGSLARTLGFRPANYNAVAVGDDVTKWVVATYPPMLELDRYITLHIEGMERCDATGPTAGCFCVLPLMSKNNNFGLLEEGGKVDGDTYKYDFVQPKKLYKLHITFKDWEGHLYDFGGQEHVLVFLIHSMSHRRQFSIAAEPRKPLC